MPAKNKIRCAGVAYRQGFIDVQANIHRGFINVETWMINPDVRLEDVPDIVDPRINDSDVIGNTELELDFDQARALVFALQSALSKINPCGK